MSVVLAGTASGVAVASVFVAAGAIALFTLAKDPRSPLQPLFRRLSPMALVMPVVVLAFPLWSIVGVLLAVAYEIAATEAPGAGLGSPNAVFTAGVLAAGILGTVPVAVLLRRVAGWIVLVGAAFVGAFGWFLPFFASR